MSDPIQVTQVSAPTPPIPANKTALHAEIMADIMNSPPETFAAPKSSSEVESGNQLEDVVQETNTETSSGSVSVPSTDDFDHAKIRAAIESEDLVSLVSLLKIKDPDKFLKINPGTFKAYREDKRRAKEREDAIDAKDKLGAEKYGKLEKGLREKYSDPMEAHKAWLAGDYDTYFNIVQKWSGASHDEVTRNYLKRMKGESTKEFELRVQNQNLQKELKSKTEETPKKTSSGLTEEKKAEARTIITNDMKGDTFESYPGLVDSLFEIISKRYHDPKDPVRTTKKALEVFKDQLRADAAIKEKFGIVKKTAAAKTVETKPTLSTSGVGRDRPTTSSSVTKSTRMKDKELIAEMVAQYYPKK